MTPIMTMLAAVAASPTCPAPAGESVAITSTVLPVYALGGDYHPENGWPAPGEARIGFVRYAWGLLLRSDDPRFTDFDLSPGPIHSRSSGCWFQWENRWGKRGVEAISTPHIGKLCPRGGIKQAVNMPQSAGPIDAYGRNYAMTGVGTAIGRYQITGARRSLRAHWAPLRRYYAL